MRYGRGVNREFIFYFFVVIIIHDFQFQIMLQGIYRGNVTIERNIIIIAVY